MRYFKSLNDITKYSKGTIIKPLKDLNPHVFEVEVLRWGPHTPPYNKEFNWKGCKHSLGYRVLRENFKEIPFNLEKVEIL